MLYAALAFWLTVTVFAAWGVSHLWYQMVRPRYVNLALLPGTLVAQLGYVLGVLITGGTVREVRLIGDERDAAVGPTKGNSPLPLVGPVIVGLLPLLFCVLAIILVLQWSGSGNGKALTGGQVPQAVPLSLGAIWDLLRDQITLMEHLVARLLRAGPAGWQAWLYAYLLICLTVRMAPLPGNVRGSIGAILLLGIVAAVVGTFVRAMPYVVRGGWPVVSLCVTTLCVLLLVTLAVRGCVMLFGLITRRTEPRRVNRAEV